MRVTRKGQCLLAFPPSPPSATPAPHPLASFSNLFPPNPPTPAYRAPSFTGRVFSIAGSGLVHHAPRFQHVGVGSLLPKPHTAIPSETHSHA